jgi:triacylglycerol lipase
LLLRPGARRLRGIQSVEEWLDDLGIAHIDVSLVWFSDGCLQIAKVVGGLPARLRLLYEQVLAAAKAFNSSYPLYVTGHSLGHALAVFAALTADLQVYSLGGLSGQVQMYSFAGPRVGDPAFSGAYDALLPASFRVVNLSDVVPVVPPSSIFGYQYSHVGQEWSYLFQTGEVAGNHSLLDNYIPTVAPTTGSPVETNAPRTYPNSGIPG